MTVQILGLILQFYSLILKPVSCMLGYLIPHFCQQHTQQIITNYWLFGRWNTTNKSVWIYGGRKLKKRIHKDFTDSEKSKNLKYLLLTWHQNKLVKRKSLSWRIKSGWKQSLRMNHSLVTFTRITGSGTDSSKTSLKNSLSGFTFDSIKVSIIKL